MSLVYWTHRRDAEEPQPDVRLRQATAAQRELLTILGDPSAVACIDSHAELPVRADCHRGGTASFSIFRGEPLVAAGLSASTAYCRLTQDWRKSGLAQSHRL